MPRTRGPQVWARVVRHDWLFGLGLRILRLFGRLLLLGRVGRLLLLGLVGRLLLLGLLLFGLGLRLLGLRLVDSLLFGGCGFRRALEDILFAVCLPAQSLQQQSS